MPIQRSQPSNVLQTIATIIIVVLNAVGNVSVVTAISRVARLQRHVSNILIASLAISDLLVIPEMLFYVVMLYDLSASRVCFVFSETQVVLFYVSILHLAAISCDRYVAVMHPLRYHSLVTPGKVKLVVALAWFLPFSSVVIISLLMGSTEGSAFRSSLVGCTVQWKKSSTQHRGHLIVNMAVFAAVPSALMMFSYARIAWVSFFQSRRVMPAIQVNDENQEVTEMRRKRKKELKWATTLGERAQC